MAHTHMHPSPQSSKDHSVPLDSTAIELSTDTDSNSTPVDPLCSETNITSRYCRVCHHSQPMRSKHCYQCGRCVRKFDHHCPWLGNCVGERNHRFFWMFLTCETALLIWGVCITWWVGGWVGEWVGGLKPYTAAFFVCSPGIHEDWEWG